MTEAVQNVSKPIILVENLSVWYGKKNALKNISIKIPQNSVTAILGPSGGGKTTFIRCLNRTTDLFKDCMIEGKVLIEGKNIYEIDFNATELRRRVGTVSQDPHPLPMSIYDNIAYGPRLHGVNKKDLDGVVEGALRSTALWDETSYRLKSPALSLSRGEQQRLSIARTLAVKPKIILLDEPCSSLDPASTSKIEDLIMNLKRYYTIVIVTHNVPQAARISDYTGFFLMGELIEFGQTRQIFHNPREKSTEDYITGRFG